MLIPQKSRYRPQGGESLMLQCVGKSPFTNCSLWFHLSDSLNFQTARRWHVKWTHCEGSGPALEQHLLTAFRRHRWPRTSALAASSGQARLTQRLLRVKTLNVTSMNGFLCPRYREPRRIRKRHTHTETPPPFQNLRHTPHNVLSAHAASLCLHLAVCPSSGPRRGKYSQPCLSNQGKR